MPGQERTVTKSGKKVMNIKQVAEYLSVHTSTIYKYAQRGTIPAFKIGSDWRFSAKHIDLWIDEKMNNKDKNNLNNHIKKGGLCGQVGRKS